MPHTWLHVFGVPHGMRAVPMTEPDRTVPAGLVVAAREPGSVMARALVEVARRTDVAAVLERLPEDQRRPGRALVGLFVRFRRKSHFLTVLL